MHGGSVTVVIPAHNAGPFLERCLSALGTGSNDHLEVIVVDDASIDETARKAAALGARVLSLEENAGPSRARNIGAASASGDYLFFLDADVAVRPGAVDRVKSYLDGHPSMAAVFGSYDAHPVEEGTLTQYRNLAHHFVHQQGLPEASTFWSGCGAVRKTVFAEMGGFDENGYPRCIEDIELGYRLRQAGHGIRLDRELLCTHLKRWTFFSLIRTDVFCRAIPWARLNFERKRAPDDLNIKESQKWSVALLGAALLLGVLGALHLGFLAAGILILGVVLLLNGPFFSFLLRERGALFATKCVPLHLLYFFYSGLSYAYVWLARGLNLEVRDGNRSARTPSDGIDHEGG
jgi:glycosyltransferase involved in cell wall biosynthesis